MKFSIQLFILISFCFLIFYCADNSEKWKNYRKIIKQAVSSYKKCNQTDCACYNGVLEADFKIVPPITESLFKEVLRGAESRRSMHYQIIDHRLYRNDRCTFPARCDGVEHFLHEIINDLPDMEFVLNVYDHAMSYDPRNVMLSFSKVRGQSHDIMYPAWTFWEGGPAVYPLYATGLGRWDLQRTLITDKAKEFPYEKKKNVGFFVGSRTNSERDPLVLLSRKKPKLVEAGYIKNQAWKSDEDTLGKPPVELVALKDHCPYKYLFNFRGVAASFRFKHLFLCNSVVFHVGDEWLEFFYEALKPWVHYIPVKKDLSDAEELLNFARENDDIVKKIAMRGLNFIVSKLRMKDVSCYWKKLLLKYHSKMQYKVVRNKKLKEYRKKRDEL